MIAANELRIGNYVYGTDGSTQKVNLEGMIYAIKYDGMNQLKPIHLTPDVLLKCGFQEGNEYLAKTWELIEWKLDYFNIRKDGDSLNWVRSMDEWGNMEYGIEINYLHQLQNLYFAIEGKELEITL